MSQLPTRLTPSEAAVRDVLSRRSSITRGAVPAVPAVTAAAAHRPGVRRRWSVAQLLAGAAGARRRHGRTRAISRSSSAPSQYAASGSCRPRTARSRSSSVLPIGAQVGLDDQRARVVADQG